MVFQIALKMQPLFGIVGNFSNEISVGYRNRER